MKHLIDIDTWERKDNYLFFRDFHNSWIAMTSEVDCTEAYAEAKAQGRSFCITCTPFFVRRMKSRSSVTGGTSTGRWFTTIR